ncbi:MAG: cupin domain-containing protein [Betaproteobacteria bacterium]|nr:cupin domain-containing protein [Betaproteobacteria bacterium]
MHARAAELISLLGLEPHPEGGHFAEVFRSQLLVSPSDSRSRRAALTVIYFLLAEGAFSRWHRVLSDEAWHWYEGSPLELLSVGPDGGAVSSATLGPVSSTSVPVHVVSAGWWQAARPLGSYALVGCSVGPGFEYADLSLLSSIAEPERPLISPKSVLDGLL